MRIGIIHHAFSADLSYPFFSTTAAVKKGDGAEVPAKWHLQIDPLPISLLGGKQCGEEGNSGGVQNTTSLWILEHITVNMCWMSEL